MGEAGAESTAGGYTRRTRDNMTSGSVLSSGQQFKIDKVENYSGGILWRTTHISFINHQRWSDSHIGSYITVDEMGWGTLLSQELSKFSECATH